MSLLLMSLELGLYYVDSPPRNPYGDDSKKQELYVIHAEFKMSDIKVTKVSKVQYVTLECCLCEHWRHQLWGTRARAI